MILISESIKKNQSIAPPPLSNLNSFWIYFRWFCENHTNKIGFTLWEGKPIGYTTQYNLSLKLLLEIWLFDKFAYALWTKKMTHQSNGLFFTWNFGKRRNFSWMGVEQHWTSWNRSYNMCEKGTGFLLLFGAH